jgi:hypothetical protein
LHAPEYTVHGAYTAQYFGYGFNSRRNVYQMKDTGQ